MNISFRKVIVCLIILMATIFRHSSSAAQGQKTLEKQILAAQEKNKTKFSSGEMKYRFTVINQNYTPKVLESTVKWYRDNAFWSFKMIDPLKKTSENQKITPLTDIPEEYKLKLKDKLYTFNAKTNSLFLNRLVYPDRLDDTYFMFDVFPDSLGSRCCPPFHSNGRNWSELVGSNYQRLNPMSEISLEKASQDTIRQTRRDPSGGIGIIDFSLAHAGLPIRMEWMDANKPDSNSLNTYRWKKVGDIFVVEYHKFLRGDFRKSEADARENIEIEVDYMKLDGSVISISFGTLKAILPKDTILIDQIKNKTEPIFGTKIPTGLSESQLEKLSKELKSKGFGKE